MRYYIVVEGKCGERKLYPHWIKHANNLLTQVFTIADVKADCYFLISGDGFPQYYNIIDNAIDDINTWNNIDFLIVAVDSEENSYIDKYNDILNYIGKRFNNAHFKINIQHTCLDTWALGNRIVFRRHPESETLRKYLSIYNVRVDDPELLPDFSSNDMNRAQFAFSYLKVMLTDRYPKLVYTKSNPSVLFHPKYFEQVQKRLVETQHIKSFQSFLDAFQ
jgi:hypothetical protein